MDKRAKRSSGDAALLECRGRFVHGLLGPEGTPDPEWTLGRDGVFATATTTTDRRGLFLLCDVPAGTRLQVGVAASPTGDPLLTNTYDPPTARPAVVARLVVPQ